MLSRQDWVLAANVATTVLVFVTAWQLFETAKMNTVTLEANRLQLSAALIQQGLNLERDYKDGKKDVRDVFSHHYLLFMYANAGFLHRPVAEPMNRTLCGFLIQDPRAREYWQSADKSSFANDYVSYIDSAYGRGKC